MKAYAYAALGVLIAGLVVAVVSRVLTEDPVPRTPAGEADTIRVERHIAALPPAGDAEPVFPAAATRPVRSETGRSSLFIVIRDSRDWPLPGVRITLRSDLDDETTHLTQGSGEAAFEKLAAGRYSYRLEAPERPKLITATPIELAEGEVKVLELRLGDYDRALRGRVLNQNGDPVAGLEVAARRYRVQADTNKVVLRGQPPQRVMTAEDGSFEITGLEEGEYEVRTLANDRYPSVKAIVRAGVDSAVLHVVESRELRVFGQITSRSGEPLAGVRVLPLGQPSRITRTDEAGRYELFLASSAEKRVYPFRFLLKGYQEARLNLKGDELRGRHDVQLDATLAPAGKPWRSSGT